MVISSQPYFLQKDRSLKCGGFAMTRSNFKSLGIPSSKSDIYVVPNPVTQPIKLNGKLNISYRLRINVTNPN